jgi:hypothetical protein
MRLYSGGFGHAMAIDSKYAVIGAYLYSGDGPQSGGAFIYKRDSTWEYQSVIRSSDGANSDIFGIAVGIDGNRIVAGTHPIGFMSIASWREMSMNMVSLDTL